MEKITITKCDKVEKPGKTVFWSCECANGSKYTVWDAEIAKAIRDNLNIECEAEIKQSGNFWNIRAFTAGNKQPKTERVQETATIYPNKDKSIVAQCLTKCVYNIREPTREEVLETYNFFLGKL